MKNKLKPKYKFVNFIDIDNRFDTSQTVTYSIAETLPELLEDILNFLRGCGYAIGPGATLEIVDPDEEVESNNTKSDIWRDSND